VDVVADVGSLLWREILPVACVGSSMEFISGWGFCQIWLA
jgi:hypothetical protein